MESVRSTGAGVTDSYELPDVGAGSQIPGLRKSSKCSDPLRYLSSPTELCKGEQPDTNVHQRRDEEKHLF